MMKKNTVQNIVFSVITVFLFATVFSSCGKKGEEDLLKGKAAYEIKDYKTAMMCFSIAAQRDNVEAQYLLGSCYYNGNGVSKDYTEAAKWFCKAADQGYAKAQTMLAFYYEYQEDNKMEAEVLFKKGVPNLLEDAKRGDAEAQYLLASCYYAGKSVEKDLKEAEKWLHKAADQGYDAAKRGLRRLEEEK